MILDCGFVVAVMVEWGLLLVVWLCVVCVLVLIAVVGMVDDEKKYYGTFHS